MSVTCDGYLAAQVCATQGFSRTRITNRLIRKEASRSNFIPKGTVKVSGNSFLQETFGKLPFRSPANAHSRANAFQRVSRGHRILVQFLFISQPP